jgi:hypothetical protein
VTGRRIGLVLGILAGLLTGVHPATSQQSIVASPTGSSANGLGMARTTTAVSSLVVMGRKGNIYSVGATIGATPGFLLGYDAITDPGNGAQTPLFCITAPAAATISFNWAPGPALVVANGLIIVFSTGANCLTETAANAFLWGTGAPGQ